MKTTKLIAIATTLLMCMSTVAVFAQTGPAPPGGGGATGAPIDGGVVALVLGAAALGYNKINERRGKTE